jgi:hypothetical protein
MKGGRGTAVIWEIGGRVERKEGRKRGIGCSGFVVFYRCYRSLPALVNLVTEGKKLFSITGVHRVVPSGELTKRDLLELSIFLFESHC